MDKNLHFFMELDKKFLQDIKENGYEGWVKYLDDDVVSGQINYHRYGKGKEFVEEAMKKQYELEEVYYTWKSRDFDYSEDLTLVDYVSEYYFYEIIEGKKLEYEGIFLFTWKLVGEEYKIAKLLVGWKT